MIKTIVEKKKDYTKRTGQSVRIYRAYPSIGRGTIFHDWIPHDDVDRRLDAALKIPFLMRFKWWLGGNI